MGGVSHSQPPATTASYPDSALLGSVAVFSTGLIAFALIPRAPVALALLVLIGGATTLFMSATNTVIQHLAPDDVRGRVLSVWSMIAAGVMPLGSLLLGGLASLTGHVALVIVGGAGVALLAALVVGVVARDPRRGAGQAEVATATVPAAS